jgi:hypothetical protein
MTYSLFPANGEQSSHWLLTSSGRFEATKTEAYRALFEVQEVNVGYPWQFRIDLR